MKDKTIKDPLINGYCERCQEVPHNYGRTHRKGGAQEMTKEELQKYGAICAERKWVDTELEEIRAILYGTQGPQLSGLPRTSVRRRSALEGKVANHTSELKELESYYEELGADLLRQQLAIEKAIDGLEPTARLLLRHRYIEGMKWEEICVAMSYSWRQAHRLHAEALRELEGVEYAGQAKE